MTAHMLINTADTATQVRQTARVCDAIADAFREKMADMPLTGRQVASILRTAAEEMEAVAVGMEGKK